MGQLMEKDDKKEEEEDEFSFLPVSSPLKRAVAGEHRLHAADAAPSEGPILPAQWGGLSGAGAAGWGPGAAPPALAVPVRMSGC